LRKTLFLSNCFLLFFYCGVLWMLSHGHIYRRSKSKLPYMNEHTCHLTSMQNTKCPLECMHYTMCILQCMQYNICYSLTLLLVITCNLPICQMYVSHVTMAEPYILWSS
jgi:hypothetical protein